jgi:type IV pilus assembly protein PilP
MCLSLGGCLLGGNADDLTEWTAEQRKQQRSRLPQIAPPKKFVPQEFVVAESVDPFSAIRLSAALRKEIKPAGGDTSALVKPELARQAQLKQPLESVPLDSMAYVGQLIRQGQPAALLKVNGLIYQVRVGDYLGQNFGKVQKIADAEISLREIVQDAEGEWSERRAVLQLVQGAR